MVKILDLCLVVARELEGICRCQWQGHKKVNVTVEVYSPVSSGSASLQLLALRSCPPVRGPCSFTSHLNSAGACSLATTSFGAHGLITHTCLLDLTRYRPLLLGREGAHVGKDFAQENSANSKFSPNGDRTHDLSLAGRARCHWATMPHANKSLLQCSVSCVMSYAF